MLRILKPIAKDVCNFSIKSVLEHGAELFEMNNSSELLLVLVAAAPPIVAVGVLCQRLAKECWLEIPGKELVVVEYRKGASHFLGCQHMVPEEHAAFSFVRLFELREKGLRVRTHCFVFWYKLGSIDYYEYSWVRLL
jgi:hypothetical protein